ncbi:MAG: hypothetical protein R2827_02910 [Bdellovibrionales bacterium]
MIGQPGIGWELQSDSLFFKVFASPMTIPNIGPQFKIKKGQALSENRWWQSPIGRVEIFGDEKQIDLDAGDMNLSGILLQPSLSLKAQYRSGPFFTSAYASLKPSSEVVVMIEGSLNLLQLRKAIGFQSFPSQRCLGTS